GKKVKCSKCATAFTAAAPAPAPPPEEIVEDPAPAPRGAVRPKPRKPAPPPPPPEEQPEEDLEDEEEPARRIRRRRPRADGGISTLIPYKNGRALAAYYCGVFALIPCAGNILGPLALIFGVLGLRFGSQHPTAGGKGHAIAGIVLGLITTIGYWG